MSPAVASPASLTGSSSHYPKYSRHVGNNVILPTRSGSDDDDDDDGITSQLSTRSGSVSSIEWRKEELRRNQRERRKALTKSNSGRNLNIGSRSLHGSSTGKKWKKLASSLVGGTHGSDDRDSLDVVQEQSSGSRRFQRRNSTKSNKSGSGGGDQLLSSHSMHGRMRRPSFTYSEKGSGMSHGSHHGANGNGKNGSNYLRRHNSSGSSSRNHPRSSSVERRNHHNGGSNSPGDALKKSIHGAQGKLGNVLATVVSPVVKSASKSLKSSDRSDTQSHASSSLQTLEKLETLYKENSGLEHENQLLLEDAQELLEENDYLAKELEVSCRKQQDLSDKVRHVEEQLEQSSELLMQFLLNTSSSKVTCSAKHMKRLREEVALFLNDHATSSEQIIDMERLHLE